MGLGGSSSSLPPKPTGGSCSGELGDLQVHRGDGCFFGIGLLFAWYGVSVMLDE